MPVFIRQYRAQCLRQLSLWGRQASSFTTSAANATSKEKVVFSGIQPTGIPHLGNYLGALRQWLNIQNYTSSDVKLFFSIADLHALTVYQSPEILRQWRKQLFAIFLAIGFDPTRSALFFQSTVPAHAELMWILSTVASVGHLSRMTQWKSKLMLPTSSTLEDMKTRSQLKLGLFSYPVLMASDILVHRAAEVPVGEDQTQHIEFTRDLANSFNHLYGEIFVKPSAMISPAKRVMSLKDPSSKMSKSHSDPRSMILLTDTDQEISMKIRSALTDSEPGISYDPHKRPGVSNLLEILSHLEEGVSPNEIAAIYHSTSLRAFKERVAEELSLHLRDIRERYVHLMSEENAGLLEDVARAGSSVANKNAEQTMNIVRNAVGL